MNLFFLLFFIPEDVFAIDEVTMFEGEDWNEKKYAVAGDILDGHLYDLFMTMLEVRDCSQSRRRGKGRDIQIYRIKILLRKSK